METRARDYNNELIDASDSKYAYGFDLDVIHPYMVQSFQPFFRQGSLLGEAPQGAL